MSSNRASSHCIFGAATTAETTILTPIVVYRNWQDQVENQSRSASSRSGREERVLLSAFIRLPERVFLKTGATGKTVRVEAVEGPNARQR